MDFTYAANCWSVVFWNADRIRTMLPRKARFTTDEALVVFAQRAGGCRTLEDKNILAMMQRNSGEIPLHLTHKQYDKLKRAR
jgi:hypothetical protein